jgi:hypothetical protein
MLKNLTFDELQEWCESAGGLPAMWCPGFEVALCDAAGKLNI